MGKIKIMKAPDKISGVFTFFIIKNYSSSGFSNSFKVIPFFNFHSLKPLAFLPITIAAANVIIKKSI